MNLRGVYESWSESCLSFVPSLEIWKMLHWQGVSKARNINKANQGFRLAVTTDYGCHGTHRSTLPVIPIKPSGQSSAEKPQA